MSKEILRLMYDTHWRTVQSCTCVQCQTVHHRTLQVFRGSCCRFSLTKSTLCPQSILYFIIRSLSILRSSFHPRDDFMSQGFPSLRFSVSLSSSLSRPRPELAGVHWSPEHRPSLHNGLIMSCSPEMYWR